MGLFDSLMRSAGNALKTETAKAVNNAASSVGKGKNHTESFTFAALPTNVTELQALPEASLDSAFKTTALTIVALCAYEKDPDACIEMLNFLKGKFPPSRFFGCFSHLWPLSPSVPCICAAWCGQTWPPKSAGLCLPHQPPGTQLLEPRFPPPSSGQNSTPPGVGVPCEALSHS